jgi:indolepyruvate ferredoxin oxidoreductase alpha subunit
MQERSHAFAMKSQIWLLDPRPNLPSIVKAVGDGFELSEASNTPVMLMVRIRSCHVTGSFDHPRQPRPKLTVREALSNPRSDFTRVVLPPMSYAARTGQGEEPLARRRKVHPRPQAERVLRPGRPHGIIVQGGMYNGVIRALQRLGLADLYGADDVPIYVPERRLSAGLVRIPGLLRRQGPCLVVEEGQPEFIEEQLAAFLYRAGSTVKLHGKGVFPMAGEYTGQVMLDASTAFLRRPRRDCCPPPCARPTTTARRCPT